MATLRDDLVSYWPLDEASGNAVDAHGSNTLTETSGTIASADGGRDFELGDTEYFAIPDNASLSCNGVSVTACGWTKFESLPATDQDIISKFETTTSNREYRVFVKGSTLKFNFNITGDGSLTVGQNVSVENPTTLSTGVWYFWAAQYNADTGVLSLWINNGTPAVLFAKNGILNGTSPLHIGALGRATPTNYVDGVIKQVGLWKRLLSKAELTYLYNSGTPRTYADTNTTIAASTVCQRLHTDGCWTWFNTPVAIYGSSANKIWVGSFPGTASKAKVAEYNLATGSVGVTSLDPDVGEDDDHDNPGLVRLNQNGKILAFWADHGGNAYHALSSSADDASAFAATTTITDTDETYAQVGQVTYNDTIYRWFREGGTDPPQWFQTSTDGTTWSAATKWLEIATEWPYIRVCRTSGTRFDIAFNLSHPNEGVASIYHCYVEVNASTGVRSWYKTDGTLIGSDAALPLDHTDCTLVYDGSTTKGWIWDIKMVDGQPTIAFARFPSTSAHEYYRGRWNGSSWDTEKICDAGTTATADYLAPNDNEDYYSGGICLDPTDEDKVYCSREYGDNYWQLQRWQKSGGSWSLSQELSDGVVGVNARPNAIDVNGTTHIFWWSGRYEAYIDYKTDVFVSPPFQAATSRLLLANAAYFAGQM